MDRQLAGSLPLELNTGEQVEIPVYTVNGELADQLLQMTEPLSPEVLQSLKQHEIRSVNATLRCR